MKDVFIRHQGFKIQPAPAMQADATQQSQRTTSLMLSIRPKLRGANREIQVGHLVLHAFHATQNEATQRELTGRRVSIQPARRSLRGNRAPQRAQYSGLVTRKWLYTDLPQASQKVVFRILSR